MALRIKDIIAGNTRAVNITFRAADGTAHDLTGAAIRLRAESSGGTEVIDINNTDNADQFTLVSAINGQVRIVLSSANTTQTAGTYNFGVEAVLTDGTVLEDTGKFKVKQQYVN
jgi:hypothetical protein